VDSALLADRDAPAIFLQLVYVAYKIGLWGGFGTMTGKLSGIVVHPVEVYFCFL
jgi:hypothetical protein